jgi:protein SCO1/2
MLRKDSRLWFLAIPIVVIGGAFLAAQLRAPAGSGEILRVGTQIDVSLQGLKSLSGKSADEPVPTGRFMLVSFGYTSCPDVCPTTLISVHQILEQLGEDAARVYPVFISIDPERDTAAVLQAYTAAFDPRIIPLSGSAVAIANAARVFHIRYARQPSAGSNDYSIDHTAMLYMLNPDHRIIAAVPETGSPRDISNALLQSVRQELAGGR